MLKQSIKLQGGAIHSRRAIEIENSLFVNNGAISNNGGSNNSSFGGAIALESLIGMIMDIRDCRCLYKKLNLPWNLY